MRKLEVGQTVYLKPFGNNVRYNKEIKEDVITKVKRKYFQVGEGYRPLKFIIEDMKQETGGYLAEWKIYFSKQEILDEEEFEKLSREIKNKFDGYGKVDLTLDQLRRIKAIISE